MKKHNVKTVVVRIAGVVFALLVLVCCLNALSDVVQRKDSDIKYTDFFEEKQDFDVLFFGSSHVLDGFYPMELWREYGITSYNFGGHGNYLPTTYWVMENALDYTTPKVVLIDTFFLMQNYKAWFSNTSFVHFSLDAFPLSVTKIKTALDLMNDPKMEEDASDGKIVIVGTENEKRDPIAFLWDFSVYHSRWNELTEEDFAPQLWRTKGSETNGNVADPDKENFVPLSVKFEEETVGKEYLRRMIEDCQKRGIQIVLTYLPHLADEKDWEAANCVYDIAEEYDIDYLDFLTMDVVDYNTDMSDSYAHLNASGAKKVTSTLGAFLTQKYGLGSHKDDPLYAGWLEDEADYLRYKGERLAGRKNLREYLMMLNDRDFNAVIDIRSIPFWKDPRYMALLRNLGVKEEDIADDLKLIAVKGGDEVSLVREEDLEDGAEVETVLGLIRLTENADREQVLLNNKEVIVREADELGKKQVDICALENFDEGNIVDNVLFKMGGSKSGDSYKVSEKKALRNQNEEDA